MEVIQTAVFNKITREDNKVNLDNFVEFLIYIMEIVEEFSYVLDSNQKNEMTKNVANKANLFNYKNIDPDLVDAIIENICKASKNDIMVNKKRIKKWTRFFCMG